MTASAQAGFVRLQGADRIAPGELRAVKLADGTRLCVGNSLGEWFAAIDACPHNAFPLSDGVLLSDGTLECGWHGARFDCRTGAVLQGPATDPLTCWTVRVAEDGVWVRRP